jgi:Flp pilus assembly protein TadG
MMPSRSRAESGQGLVELALILPIFLLLIIGLFDVGRGVYAYNTVANSARSAARVAIVNQDPDAVTAAAIQEGVALGLEPSDVTFVDCGAQYCLLEVTVSWDFEPITPLIGELFNPDISSTAQMPMEVKNP